MLPCSILESSGITTGYSLGRCTSSITTGYSLGRCAGWACYSCPKLPYAADICARAPPPSPSTPPSPLVQTRQSITAGVTRPVLTFLITGGLLLPLLLHIHPPTHIHTQTCPAPPPHTHAHTIHTVPPHTCTCPHTCMHWHAQHYMLT